MIFVPNKKLMKNSTLFFRTLFFIILIAGTAHLVTYASQQKVNTNESLETEVSFEDTVEQTKQESKTEENNRDLETDYIIGKWKVIYDDKDFKGGIVYEIKKEGNVFNASTLEYQDEKGNSQKAKKIKTLVIKKFDGYKGKGIYIITYKGKKYDVECDIDMVDENTFKLSYESYGYSDIETWERQ